MTILKKYTMTVTVAFMLLFSGCSMIEENLAKTEGSVFEKQLKTEQVETAVTNDKGEPVRDEDGEIVYETETRPVIGKDGEPVYRWKKTGYSETAEDIAGSSGIPWAGTAVTTLLSAGLAVLNRKERKKRKTAENDLTIAEGISASLIGAVEEFSRSEEGKKVMQNGRNTVKEKTRQISEKLGIDKELHDKVQKIVSWKQG